MTLVSAPDPRWRELFARADTVSEGCTREEAAGPIWYGSTSLILRPEGLKPPVSDPAFLSGLVARDIHVRLRAVRTAVREACLRAPGRLGLFTCEIRVIPDPQGVRIDVDIQAPLIEGRSQAKLRAKAHGLRG